MPEPRVRRSKPRAPRAVPPPVAAPDVEAQDAVAAPASLAAADAASAEAEAELEAAASIAAVARVADAEVEPNPDEDLPVDEDAEPTPDGAAAAEPEPDQAAEPEPDQAEEGVVAAESAGWFRDAPLDEDGSASGDATAVEPEVAVDRAAEPDLAPVPEADLEPVVRERDRPVVTSVPVVEGPPRTGRLRGFLMGLATIAIVAVAGFVAGLMLPVILPGPGVTTDAPSPSAAATPVATTPGGSTAAPTDAPSAAPTPAPTATPAATPAPTTTVYVVRSGDQLTRIAKKYGVTVAAIQEANKITDPNLIRVGQKLIIPLPVPSPAP